MPQLKFTVATDWQEVIKLKNKIDELKSSVIKLRNEMSSIDVNKNPLGAEKLTSQLSKVNSELRQSEGEVTKYGLKIGTDLKSQIYKASQSVNSLSSDIIKQKDIIRQTKDDVQQLSDKYKSMSKYDAGAGAVKSQLNSAKAALNEQKFALGDLQSEQAKAKLSVKSLNDEFKMLGTDSSASIGTIADKFRSLTTLTIAGIGIKETIGQIISVRGEFETIETSIGVLLNGNKQKTTEVMNELKQYALISPLTTKDMAGALQMMMGFGLKADDSIKYLKALGDISMGNTGKFNSLALAFSQMSSAGKLMGQDLNQMINAGFNPLSIISEKTGKSIGELKQQMEKGAISSQMVQQAFISATSAGGKFYGMAAAGAKTVNGQVSMLQESFQNALNSIGTKGEGVILTGIKGATSLVNNYQEVISIITELLAVYGTYKTAIMVTTALQGIQTIGAGSLTIAEAAHYAWLVVVEKAQKALNATMLANPYVLAATALALVGVAVYEYEKNLDNTNKKADKFNEQLAKEKEHLGNVTSEISKLLPVAQDSAAKTKDRENAIKQLQKVYPSYFKSLNIETSKNYSVADSLKAVARQHYNVLKMKELEAKVEFQKTVKAEKQARQAANTTNTSGNSVVGSVQMGTYQQSSLTQATTERKAQQNLLWAIGSARRQAGLDLMKADKSVTENTTTYSSAKSESKKKLDKATAKYDKLKNSKTATVAQVSDAKASKDAAEKDYNNKYGGNDDAKESKAEASAAKKEETKSEKENKRRNAIAEALRKQKEDIANSNIDLDKKLTDAQISSEENENNKKLLELEKSHKDELDTINKNERELLQKRTASAKSVFTASGGKGTFNASSVSLSSDETDKYNQLRLLSDKKYQKDKDKLQEEDVTALNDFYEKYGTYEEKKLAITKDYEKKIAEASNEGTKMALAKQMNDAISSLDFTNLKEAINWDSVFGDLSNASTSFLNTLASQLQDILTNNKNLAITEIKEIADKLQIVRNQLGKKNNWFYSPTMEESNDAKENLSNAQSEYSDASAGSALASTSLQLQQSSVSGALSSVGINANFDDIKSSDRSKYTSQIDSKDFKSLAKVNREFDKLTKAESKSTLSKQKETDASKNLAKANTKYQQTQTSLQVKVGAFGESMSSFNDKMKDLPGLLDEIGLGNTGAAKAVNNGLNAAKDVEGAAADYASGNYIGAAMKGISAVKNAGAMLGIGGGNGAETQKTIDRLTKSNEYLKASIDGLSKKIGEASGADAAVLGIKAVSAQQSVEQNYRDILNAQMNYHGAHHSNAAKWDMSDDSMNTLKKDKGLDAAWLDNSWDSFKKLTADQMDYIRTNHATIWREMIEQGEYGFKQEWNDYADQANKVKELTDEVKTSINQVSFDDMYSSFTDSLLDMKKDAQSWADDLSSYLMKAMLKAQLDKLLKPKLQAFYDSFANDMGDNVISSTEKTDLTKQWNDLIEQGKIIRDSVASATGYDTSSAATATKETSVSASQDSVSEANGRMTAIQEVLIEGKTLADLNLSEMKNLNLNMGKMVINVDGIRDTLNNSYMEIQGIHRDTTNLTDIIKPIKQLGDDISIIKDKLKTL